jgi:hypothetical protein
MDGPQATETVLDVAKLNACIRRVRDSRQTELLQQEHDGTAPMPSIVILKTNDSSVKILTSDLMLCTAAGRGQRSALAADNVIILPDAEDDDSASEVLDIMSLIFRERFQGCPAHSLGRLIQHCNFLVAEGVLDGKATSSSCVLFVCCSTVPLQQRICLVERTCLISQMASLELWSHVHSSQAD